jgi:hypothetical protein
MPAATGLKEYLEEFRQDVCWRCPRWPSGGRAEPGAGCWIDLELPRLIDAIHEARGELAVADVEEVGAQCDLLHGPNGLCPTEDLSVGLVRAVEWVDERRRQWECVCSWVTHPQARARVPVREMIRAYEEGSGELIGCD